MALISPSLVRLSFPCLDRMEFTESVARRQHKIREVSPKVKRMFPKPRRTKLPGDCPNRPLYVFDTEELRMVLFRESNCLSDKHHPFLGIPPVTESSTEIVRGRECLTRRTCNECTCAREIGTTQILNVRANELHSIRVLS